MTNNESQPHAEPQISYRDRLMGKTNSTPRYRNFGDELGEVLERRAQEREEQRAAVSRRYIAHAAGQLVEFTRISVVNEIMMAGNPALRLVGNHAIAELNKPRPASEAKVQVAEPASTGEYDDRPSMTLNQIRQMINDENVETAIYNADTAQDHPQITDDPVTYARKNNIRVQY